MQKIDQAEFKSNLSEIKKGNKKHRSKKQKIPCVILKCFTKQETIFWWLFFNGIRSKTKETKGTGLRILTPKQNASKIINSSCTSKTRQ